jgi:hypothetical protein
MWPFLDLGKELIGAILYERFHMKHDERDATNGCTDLQILPLL